MTCRKVKNPHITPGPKKRPKNTYYLRKSKARKSYLNKVKHIRKFKSKKTYSNTITCFTCSKARHLSLACPHRTILCTREVILAGCTNLDLIEVQSNVVDASSIYSIKSVEDIEGDYRCRKKNSSL